jgi:hypothetical protein
MIFLIGFSLLIIRAVGAGFRPKDVRADAYPTGPENFQRSSRRWASIECLASAILVMTREQIA